MGVEGCTGGVIFGPPVRPTKEAITVRATFALSYGGGGGGHLCIIFTCDNRYDTIFSIL